MAYSEVFKCDRKGCKQETDAMTVISENGIKYPYKNDSWIRRNTIENGEVKERDFCSSECEAVWLDSELKKKEGG